MDRRPNVVDVCLLMALSNDAQFGWAELHVNPHLMRLAFFAATTGVCIIACIMYGVGLPWPTEIMQIPLLLWLLCTICSAAWIWRTGPKAATEPVYKAVNAVGTLPHTFLAIVPFIGPNHLVPFGSQLANIIGSACFVFAGFCASAFGGAAADHPPQPHESLTTPLVKATFTTLRCVDNMTDYGFARILMLQGPECTWFGAAVPCSFYARLAIAAACIAAAKSLLGGAVMTLGGQGKLFTSTGSWFKVAAAANTAIMLCELAGVTIAALKVFSDMRRPGGAASAGLRRDAAFAVASGLLTLASFVVNVLGMRRVLRMLRMLRGAAAGFRSSFRLSGLRSSVVAPAESVVAPTESVVVPAAEL